MGYLINSTTLLALGGSKSTRVKCLHELEVVLNNNITFNNVENDPSELQVVNFPCLIKKLILWFNLEDDSEELNVLKLILKLVKKNVILQQITKEISIQRLHKELNKISKIVHLEESHRVIAEIIDNLVEPSLASQFPIIDLTEHLAELQIGLDVCMDADLALPWAELAGFDLELIEKTHDALKSENGTVLKSKLGHLIVLIKNHPIEYFLQTPNIMECLIEITLRDKESVIQVMEILALIINHLADRIIFLQTVSKPPTAGPSIKTCSRMIILFALKQLGKICQDPNEIAFQLNLRASMLTQLYNVLFDFAKILSNINCVCSLHLNELLKGLAAYAKTLRISYESSMCEHERLHYVIAVYLMSIILSICNVDNLTDSEEHTLWEYESDLALLDIPMKVCFPVIYKIIKRNRMNCIKNDNDMKTLLCGNKVWIHVVELFKSDEIYRACDIVQMSTLDTIYIHQSVDLVALLFNSVLKCAEQFPNNKDLQVKSAGIVLRLLANKIHAIKRTTYNLVANSLKRRLCATESCSKTTTNLCLLLGIPLNTEIVVEILCFGLGHSDSSINSNAEIILQTLLRAKCIYEENWLQILEILRPVLPILPCICEKNEKLTFFAFEIFNTGLGLSNDELIDGFGRFLFCNNYILRARAKDKLFQLLGLQDQIDLVDGNFCILQNGLVTKLVNIPQQSNASFDLKAFTCLMSLLKEIDRNNLELLRNILLQLDVMMISSEVCQLVHDNHIWVYIMESLGASFIHHEQLDILKLTISMLYKLSFTVPSFRKFLANEHELNVYILKALVFHSDDVQIKKHSTSLFFILMFNDFFVGSGCNLSLPKVFKSLNLPFEINFHWKDSPFDQQTPLETIFVNCEKNIVADVESYDITWRYLRFVFASIWFERLLNIISKQVFKRSLYFEQSGLHRTMQFNEKLLLTDQDLILLEHTSVTKRITKVLHNLKQSVAAKDILSCLAETERLLMLPIETIEQTPLLIKRLQRCINLCNNSMQEYQVLLKLLNLINKFVTGGFPGFGTLIICEVYNKNSVLTRMLSDPTNQLYQELLLLIRNVSVNCLYPSIDFEQELKELKKTHKISFPHKMFELLANNLHEAIINEEHVSITMSTLRFLLASNNVNCDRQYAKVLIHKLLRFVSQTVQLIPRSLTSLLTSTLAVVLQLIGMHEHALEKQNIVLILVLAKQNDSSIRALCFEILARASLDKACLQQIMEELNYGLLGLIDSTIMNEDHDISVKSGAVGILANLIEHNSLIEHSKEIVEYKTKDQQIFPILEMIKSHMFYNKLLESFLLQDSVFPNLKAYCFMIKKLVQLDTFIISDLIERNVLQGVFGLIPMCKHLDVSSALSTASEVCNLLTYCWQDEPFQKLLKDYVFHSITTHVSDLFEILQTALFDNKEANPEFITTVTRNVCNLLQILVTFEGGQSDVLECLVDERNCQTFVYALSNGLHLNNRYNELSYHLCFLKNMLGCCSEYLVKQLETQKVSTNYLDILSAFSSTQKLKTNLGTIFDSYSNCIEFAVDVILLRVFDIYINIDHSKYSMEYKLELKALAYSVLVKMLRNSQRGIMIIQKINLFELILQSLELTVRKINGIRHQEAVKKLGVKKCNYTIKKLCLEFKSLSEWNLPLNCEKVKSRFNDSVKIFDWIEADSFLLNAYISFLSSVAKTNNLGTSLLETNAGGRSMIKVIAEKLKQLTLKTPHTENNVVLLKNGLNFLFIFCQLVEFRVFLKNDKIFRIFENLHPQVNKHKKSTWDIIVVLWLQFLEQFSQFDDTECDAGLISLLCRLVRTGNKNVRELSLKAIRNFSLKSSIGVLLMSSEDFTYTIDLIMTQNEEASDEKYLVVMTLLSITCKCERSKSKVKNSNLCRKLKLSLQNLEANTSEYCRLYNCIYMLNNILN